MQAALLGELFLAPAFFAAQTANIAGQNTTRAFSHDDVLSL